MERRATDGGGSDARVGRREVLAGGLGAFLAALLHDPRPARAAAPLLGFRSVAVSRADTVVVPEGYEWRVLCAWGDPLSDGPAWRPDAGNSAADQLLQAGMHHDGMEFFADPHPSGASEASSGLLAVNHEYADERLLVPPGTAAADRVAKSQAAHGVSILEVRKVEGSWQVARPSARAWRVHPGVEVEFTGPAASGPLLGPAPFRDGTLANCASGRTPWGTFLTCEENFDAYLSRPSGAYTDAERAYGLHAPGKRDWAAHDPRFDLDARPHAANRYGWVVEVDPSDRSARPRKHTALGRLKHENACVVAVPGRRLAVYMGDDQRLQFLYKFVSDHAFDPARRDLRPRYLAEGVLHAARFGTGRRGETRAGDDDEARGTWIPLVETDPRLAKGFPTRAHVLVNARTAARAVGATPLDRPEWVARHPGTGALYAALTSDPDRALADTDPANPRARNVFGHVLRWREDRDDPAAASFSWERFLLAGDPERGDPGPGPRSPVAFGCPDGLAFDERGVLWIQTDVASDDLGKPAFATLGNNQMLAADPATREVRRFLVGPVGCEITGFAMMPDLRSVLVNVQHPGEAKTGSPTSTWPHGVAGVPPRSATILVWKRDGGVVGT